MPGSVKQGDGHEQGWAPPGASLSGPTDPDKDKRKHTGAPRALRRCREPDGAVWARVGVKARSLSMLNSLLVGKGRGLLPVVISSCSHTGRVPPNQVSAAWQAIPSRAGEDRKLRPRAGKRIKEREGRAAGVCGRGQAQEARLRAQSEEAEGEGAEKVPCGLKSGRVWGVQGPLEPRIQNSGSSGLYHCRNKSTAALVPSLLSLSVCAKLRHSCPTL